MSEAFAEPSIPEKFRRPLAALWISLGLHGALIALVQVAPLPPGSGGGEPALAVRLEPLPLPQTAPAAPPAAAPSRPTPPETESALSPKTGSRAAPDAPVSHDRPRSASAPLTVPLALDLRYYSARELDVQPRALVPIEPVYPAAAAGAKLSGKVRLQLKVEESGAVSSVELLDASPPGVFDAAALSAFRAARLAPAIRDGVPVRAQIVIEVTFDYAGRLVAPDAEREIDRQ